MLGRLSKLFSQSRSATRTRVSSRLLHLEILEDRTVPSTIVVNINDPNADAPGDNLFAQIHEALAVASEKDVIKVHSGTYEPFTVSTNHLTIRKANSNSFAIVDATGFQEGVTVNANEVTIRGLMVTGASRFGFLINGSDNLLQGNTADGNRSAGFAVLSFPNPGQQYNNTLTENTATRNGTGILVVSNDNATVTRNSTYDNLSTGIALSACNNSTIRSNSSTGNGDLGFSISGDNNTLIGNSAQNNRFFGYQISGAGTRVISNSAIANQQNGFNFVGLNESDISANASIANGSSGFAFFGSSNNRVRANRSLENIRAGYVLGPSTSTGFVDLNFQQRTARLVLRSASTSDNNDFAGNLASDNGEYGFYLIGASGNRFVSNRALHNGFDGFRIEGAEVVVPSRFGVLTLLNAGEVLATFESDDNFFLGNTSRDNGGWGFYFEEMLANIYGRNFAYNNDFGDTNF